MERKIFLIGAIVCLSLFAGCISNESGADVTQIAKTLPMVQEFLGEHPNAEIKVALWNSDAVEENIVEIRESCGQQMEVKSYWKVVVTEGNLDLEVWIDESTQKVVCAFKKGVSEPMTTTTTSTTITLETTLEPTTIPTTAPTTVLTTSLTTVPTTVTPTTLTPTTLPSTTVLTTLITKKQTIGVTIGDIRTRGFLGAGTSGNSIKIYLADKGVSNSHWSNVDKAFEILIDDKEYTWDGWVYTTKEFADGSMSGSRLVAGNSIFDSDYYEIQFPCGSSSPNKCIEELYTGIHKITIRVNTNTDWGEGSRYATIPTTSTTLPTTTIDARQRKYLDVSIIGGEIVNQPAIVQIRDSNTQDPIEGVNVDTYYDGARVSSEITNDAGVVVFTPTQIGNYLTIAEASRYYTEELDWLVSGG